MVPPKSQTRPRADKVKPKGWFKYLILFYLNIVDYLMLSLLLST